MNIIKIKWFY